MLGPLTEMSAPAKRTIMRAMLFDPMRIRGLSCVLELSENQLEVIEEIASCVGIKRDLVETEVREAGDRLAASFTADPLDADAVRESGLAVRQRDAQMFAEMVVSAARVRDLLTVGQRKRAVTVPMGMESTPVSGIPVW